MNIVIIIVVCVLLLISYFFDLTASRTKIPSVILLMVLGWIVKMASEYVGVAVPNLEWFLPVVGTIGLVLIVLEWSLELQLNASRIQTIKKSFFMSLFPMIIAAGAIAFAFYYMDMANLKNSLINAIPFCVISSAIAIPSVRYLKARHKEFIVYESSISDILGVLLFNFMLYNQVINLNWFMHFWLELLLMCIISFASAVVLSLLLSRLNHHIKFTPIILLIILIYAISKFYHLPALIFILIFGIFVGNLDTIRHIPRIEKLHPEELDAEVSKLKETVGEASFLVRSFFFILFWYLVRLADIANTQTLIRAISIVLGVLFIRRLWLKLLHLDTSPLLYIMPRWLITILLFISITPEQRIAMPSDALIIQVILLTSLLMMFGIMASKKNLV